MKPGKHSRTAIVTAAMRAAHQILDDAPHIIEDTYALPFAGFNSDKELVQFFGSQEQVGFAENRAYFSMRHRYVEDELFRFIESNASINQYVILGSGLDSFAHRYDIDDLNITVFEVDHPDSLAWKKERIAKTETTRPENLRYIPLDFTVDPLVETLRNSGVSFQHPVFVSWLGVSLYLVKEAVRLLLSDLSENCVPGSTIVFDYVLNDRHYGRQDREIVTYLSQRSANVGEPWQSKFDPEELENQLFGFGFRKCCQFSTVMAMQRYFKGRNDSLSLPGYPQLIKVVK